MEQLQEVLQPSEWYPCLKDVDLRTIFVSYGITPFQPIHQYIILCKLLYIPL